MRTGEDVEQLLLLLMLLAAQWQAEANYQEGPRKRERFDGEIALCEGANKNCYTHYSLIFI